MMSMTPEPCHCCAFWPGFSLLTALLFETGGQAERASWNAREHTSLLAVGEAAGTGPRSRTYDLDVVLLRCHVSLEPPHVSLWQAMLMGLVISRLVPAGDATTGGRPTLRLPPDRHMPGAGRPAAAVRVGGAAPAANAPRRQRCRRRRWHAAARRQRRAVTGRVPARRGRRQTGKAFPVHR